MNIFGKITGIKYKNFITDNNISSEQSVFMDALFEEAKENKFIVEITNAQ